MSLQSPPTGSVSCACLVTEPSARTVPSFRQKGAGDELPEQILHDQILLECGRGGFAALQAVQADENGGEGHPLFIASQDEMRSLIHRPGLIHVALVLGNHKRYFLR